MSQTVTDWTPNQEKFIRWLATPEDLRERRTHADFAESIGVAERTLYRWKELPGLTRAAASLAREMLAGDLPEIYGALVKQAKAGSFQHIKLALEVAEHYVEKHEHSGSGGGPIRIVEVSRGDDGDANPGDASWP